MRYLIRICGEAVPDSKCSGNSGDEFVPVSALGPGAYVATCVDVRGLRCVWTSPVVYRRIGDLHRSVRVFLMDEDSDFDGVLATLDHTPGGASVVVVPFPPALVEWTFGVAWVVVLAVIGLGVREISRRVVDVQKRIRA